MDNYVNCQNIRIHYTTKGSGKTIVLLHGFLESNEIWNYYSEQLLQDFRVVCIDLPGHGRSTGRSDIHTMDFMAKGVKVVLDHLDIQSCVLIGHSMGGYVALAFAEKHPELLKGFGLFHSQAGADSEEAKANRDRTIGLVEQNRLGFIQMFIPDLFAPANRKKYGSAIEILKKQAAETSATGIISALKGMKERPDRTMVLKNTRLPVLFILGRKDSRISVEAVLKQAMHVHRCEIHILGEVGHMGYIEEEAYCLQTIRNFVAKCFQNPQD